MSDEKKLLSIYEKHGEIDRQCAKLAQADKERPHGDAEARAAMERLKSEKNKLMQDARAIEREGNRAGRVMSVIKKNGRVTGVEVEQAESKRELQKDYIRKIDQQDGGKDAATVLWKTAADPEGRETTRADAHRKRLLG